MPTPPAERGAVVTGAMRITVDGRRLKDAGTGIAVYLDAAVRAIIASGAEVTLLTDEHDHAQQLAETYGTRTDALPEARTFRWEQRELRRYLRIHEPDVHYCGANYGLPAFFRGRTKLALTVHDLIPLLMPRTYLTPRPRWAARYLLSLAGAASAADLVIVNSQPVADAVRRFMRVKNSVALYPSLPQKSVPPEHPDRADDAPYFLYSGGYDPRKNVPQLIEAMDQLVLDCPGVQLVCTGRPPDDVAALMDGRQDCIRRSGFVSAEEMTQLLDGAAGLVYPSSYEGFGLPIVEGFLHGVPVVTGTGGSLREVAGDAAIFIDPEQPSSIAKGMSRALDPRTRDELLVKAANQVALLRRHPSIDSIGEVLSRLAGR